MGGYGSGWKGPTKTQVEDCLVLSLTTLLRRKALVPGAWMSGSWSWLYEGREPHATLGYEASLCDPANAWLRLHYSVRGEPVDYRIRLVTTRPTYGGVRWWFICPLVRRDGGPPRRVAKLYLPSGGRYFGSRLGYGLTYASCQESGKFRGLFHQLAAAARTDEATVRRSLGRRVSR